MTRKALPLVVIVAVAGMIGLVGMGLVAAQQADLSRSLPVAPVAPDDEFTVTINNVGLADGFGSVEETLPAGFSYVGDSAGSSDANAVIDAVVDGRTVTFTVVGVDSFTYRVTVGSDVADGPHTFKGVLKKLSGDETIADSTVTVGGPAPEPGDLSRSLPAGPVAPDDEFTVTINNVGLADGFGSVEETLPAGFSYVDDSAASPTPNAVIGVEVSADGRTVTFAVVGVDSFTYRVTVGSDVADGPHTFKGVLKKLSGDETIADSTITVGGPAPQPGDLSRSLPAGPVAPDDEFTVAINNVGLANGFGEVEETLPAGFSYVDNSAASTDAKAVIDAEVDGQTVTFTVVGVDSFTYRVTVGSDVADGPHTFKGVLKKLSGDETIADSTITVGGPAPQPGDLSRSLPAGPVAPDDEFTVTINNVGLADGFGSVEETLPAGFSYVDDSAASSDAKAVIDAVVNGRTVTFTVVGVDSFTYRVTVGSDVADGPHTFKGVLKKLSGDETIADSTVTVGTRPAPAPAPTPAPAPAPAPRPSQTNEAPYFREGPKASRSVAEASTSGTTVGERVAAEGLDRIAYTLIGDDADSFAIDPNSGQITVGAATSLDYEVKDSYKIRVRATDPLSPIRGRDEIEVTIAVINVDEAGKVSLSSMEPQVGTVLTATVTDPDGSVADVTWSWAKSSDQSAWTDISGATSATYTPVRGDGENYLRATATYIDGEGSGKTAVAGSANAVHVPNTAPSFPATESGIRSVAENTKAGEDVGASVAATDADDDPLTYTLSGVDDASFEIDASSGQLKTKEALDYETRSSYAVTVTVSDGRGGNDSIALTITVTDVDETPPPTATATPPPPAATPTPRPTATATPPPPAATPTPRPTAMPEATPTPEPTVTPVTPPAEGGGFPAWLMGVIVVVVVSGLLIGGFAFIRTRRGQ